MSSDTVKPMRMPIFAQRPAIGRGTVPTDPGGPSPEVLTAALAASSSRNTPRADATVLSGGRLTGGATVSEQYLLDLEREAFLSLCGNPKTQERMQHTLKTGKPLRN